MSARVGRSLVWFLGLVRFLVLIELASTVLVVAVWRTRWQPGIDFLRWFNKKVGNPAWLRMAGKRITKVHHTGRQSGTEYVTPVCRRVEGSNHSLISGILRLLRLQISGHSTAPCASVRECF